ncbi:alpha/beta fold hydrolase [Marinobacter mobilis]|uniref:alpha/beta fold hydrolase n=1 Tax=Marinobacter mobilis TaxID=488533 RepID=UPI0035C77A72
MASLSSYPAIVVVGGWGVPATMLQPLVADWPGVVHLATLNSGLVAGACGIDDVAARLLNRLPEAAVWLGWSQGGQVVMSAARQAPDQLQGAITLCSFPRFVASNDWNHGMAADTFRQFHDGLRTDPMRAWKRFLALQVMGGSNEKDGRRSLAPWLASGPPLGIEELETSLEWLAATDQRADWQHPAVPSLHIWGDQDYLVDSHVADQVSGWGAEVSRVSGMGHWPRGSAIACCQDEIRRFVASLGIE